MNHTTCCFCGADTKSHFLSVCLACLLSKGQGYFPKLAMAFKTIPGRPLFRPAALCSFLSRVKLEDPEHWLPGQCLPLLLKVSDIDNHINKAVEQVQWELGLAGPLTEPAVSSVRIKNQEPVNCGEQQNWRKAIDRLLTSCAEEAGGVCVYCRSPMEKKGYEMDTVLPMNIDHSSVSARSNYFYHQVLKATGLGKVSCSACNRRKGTNEGKARSRLHGMLAGKWSMDTGSPLFPKPGAQFGLPLVLENAYDPDSSPENNQEECSPEEFAILCARLGWLALRLRSLCTHHAERMTLWYYPEALTVSFDCKDCETLPGAQRLLVMTRSKGAAELEARQAVASAKSEDKKKAKKMSAQKHSPPAINGEQSVERKDNLDTFPPKTINPEDYRTDR